MIWNDEVPEEFIKWYDENYEGPITLLKQCKDMWLVFADSQRGDVKNIEKQMEILTSGLLGNLGAIDVSFLREDNGRHRFFGVIQNQDDYVNAVKSNNNYMYQKSIRKYDDDEVIIEQQDDESYRFLAAITDGKQRMTVLLAGLEGYEFSGKTFYVNTGRLKTCTANDRDGLIVHMKPSDATDDISLVKYSEIMQNYKTLEVGGVFSNGLPIDRSLMKAINGTFGRFYRNDRFSSIKINMHPWLCSQKDIQTLTMERNTADKFADDNKILAQAREHDEDFKGAVIDESIRSKKSNDHILTSYFSTVLKEKFSLGKLKDLAFKDESRFGRKVNTESLNNFLAFKREFDQWLYNGHCFQKRLQDAYYIPLLGLYHRLVQEGATPIHRAPRVTSYKGVMQYLIMINHATCRTKASISERLMQKFNTYQSLENLNIEDVKAIIKSVDGNFAFNGIIDTSFIDDFDNYKIYTGTEQCYQTDHCWERVNYKNHPLFNNAGNYQNMNADANNKKNQHTGGNDSVKRFWNSLTPAEQKDILDDNWGWNINLMEDMEAFILYKRAHTVKRLNDEQFAPYGFTLESVEQDSQAA